MKLLLVFLSTLLVNVIWAGSEAQVEISDDAHKKARVLIITGMNNHNWKATTPVLEEILDTAGKFEVDVEANAQNLTRDRLASYDLILSNWNTYGKKPEPWHKAFREIYVEYVRKGGGHIAIHAGTSSFYDCADYQALCLATWKPRQTSHKEHHKFAVRISEPEHPAIMGLQDFKIFDELWFRPEVQADAIVLAESFSKTTGNWEPTAFAGTFGEGRCFTILLGHNVRAMENEGFRSLLQQAAEWVANKR